MTKPYFIFYYVNGEIFKNTDNKFNGLEKAKRYCKDNNIQESEIKSFANESELRYYNKICYHKDYEHLKTRPKITLIKGFKNFNGDNIQSLTFEPSFIYQDKDLNWHYIVIPKSIFEIDKELINTKILFDYLNKEHSYLEVFLENPNGDFVEWKCDLLDFFKQAKKEFSKAKQKRLEELNESLKYERLIRLRSEGKITKTQSKELYKLEKKWGGNNV